MTRTEKWKEYRNELALDGQVIISKLNSYNMLKEECDYERGRANLYEHIAKSYEELLND